jgi:replicative DNA helicase
MDNSKELAQKKLSEKMVKEFMARYPNFPAWTLQLFKDDWTDNTGIKMKIESWWFERCWDYNKWWRWIYFSVNEMLEWKRDKASVTKIRVWIVECDSLDKNTQFESYVNSPIPPSLLIESKKSYNEYWLAEDWDKETYEAICWWLKQHFNWDQAVVKDYSRVLRIPWFYHLKNPSDPFLIKIIYKDEEKKTYTKEQMMKAFPFKTTQEVKEGSTETKEKFWWVRDTMKNRDHRKMLQDLSWTWLMDWQEITFTDHWDWTEQICISGKQTWSWMDIEWKIGSYKWWWPYWFNRVLFYQNITRPELLKRTLEKYKENFPEDIYNKEMSKMRVKKTLSMADIKENFRHITYKEKLLKSMAEIQNTNPTESIKWWREEFDSKLWWIKTGKIYLFGAESWQGKTTFVNLVVDNVVKQWHQVVRYSLEDRLEDKGKEDLFDEINRLRFASGKLLYQWIHFENNEYWSPQWQFYDEEFNVYMDQAIENLWKMQITELERNKPVSIKELSILISEKAKEWVRFFVIDHLHYFSMVNSDRRDLEIQEIMLELNDLVRFYNISIFLIAHYSNYKKLGDKPHPSMFKDGASIKQVANIIIQIVSDSNTGETEFYFTKVRGRYRIPEGVIMWRYDINTSTYAFKKTIDQIVKEKKRWWW